MMTRRATSRPYQVGLLRDDRLLPPARIRRPLGFPFEGCYRLDPRRRNRNPADAANSHLLAAFGRFGWPFIPVSRPASYFRKKYARLCTVTDVKVAVGKKVHEGRVGKGRLTCVKSITITARTSDGRVYSSSVPMAVPPYRAGDHTGPYSLYITVDAFKDKYFESALRHLTSKRDRL